MDYIIQRAGRFYYNRRVPTPFRRYDNRKFIRIALNTDSRVAARRRAVFQNEQLEKYWATLVQTSQPHDEKRYKAVVDRAQLFGFFYRPCAELTELPIKQIAERFLHVEKQSYSEPHIEAVLGGIMPPVVMLDDVLTKYWEYSKDKIINKSPSQIRKWENPRIKAFRNFLGCIGNKPLQELTREDMLRFRGWWLDRIKDEELVCATANKDFRHIRTIITTVADNLKIKIDADHIFKKIRLKENDSKIRPPFETAHITDVLLKPENLAGLNEHAKYALYAVADTGTGISELVGLEKEDIILDADIPHIWIRPRKEKGLKTQYRPRKIPLVGYALEAFKACPSGFTDYKDRPDSLSTVLGKYLNENGLFPTEEHSVYSLRHSFQDRLLEVNAPDRVQTDLMGHKFNREVYGKGSTLEKKFEWMQKVRLK